MPVPVMVVVVGTQGAKQTRRRERERGKLTEKRPTKAIEAEVVEGATQIWRREGGRNCCDNQAERVVD